MKFEILARCSAVRHLVTEKDGGFGCGFSMALHTGEAETEIRRNRAVLAEAFGASYRFCGIRQTHSDKIHRIKEPEGEGWRDLSDAVEADALITNLPHMVLTVLTADCVPILLYDPQQGAVGAVHAGWRGSRAEILPKTIAAMQDAFGCVVEDMLVAIGPAIGQCCYEVGLEVAEHFRDYVGAVIEGRGESKYMLDLKEVSRLQASACGILPAHIEVTEICTSCSRDRFFSYRAEQGCSGRFLSAIALKGEQEGLEGDSGS